MAGDIEAFLRMAAERRRQAQGGGPPAGRVQPVPPPPAAKPEPRKPLAPSLTPLESNTSRSGSSRAAEPEVDPYAQVGDLPQRPKSAKAKPKERNAARPTPAAEKPRLQPTVERTLQRSPVADTEPGPEPYAAKSVKAATSETLTGNQIVQMLKSPHSIASAMVLSEILKPIDFD